MTNFVASWKPGFEFAYKADPNKVYEEIQSLGETCSKEDIVNKARDASTELHSCFEWNDSKAAEKYRLYQANDIVRHLYLVRQETDEEDAEQEDRKITVNQFRCFSNLGKNNEYESTIQIVRNEDKYQLLLEQAKRELRAFKQKYAVLKELKPILDLID